MTTHSDQEIYEYLIPQLEVLVNPEEPLISNLSNLTAALKESFKKISWVGFYIRKNNHLYLGPFQGKVACTVIVIGKGVCGSSAERKETIIVEDVEKFPGHILCDAGSRSEIVVPLFSEDQVAALLDIDSYQMSAFGKIDGFYLEKICKMLSEKLDFSRINFS